MPSLARELMLRGLVPNDCVSLELRTGAGEAPTLVYTRLLTQQDMRVLGEAMIAAAGPAPKQPTVRGVRFEALGTITDDPTDDGP